MELILTLASGDVLIASEVFLSRQLGSPVRWRFNVKLRPGDWGPEERELERKVHQALLQGPCKATPGWRSEGGGTLELGPEVTIVSASRSWGGEWSVGAATERATQSLEIQASGTDVAADDHDPFLPRRRVHRVRNLKELVLRFAHVAEPIGALRGELEGVKLPDPTHASIIQDGVSDWQFLHHIFDQCCWLKADAHWLPLTLVGGVEAATEGRWVITPGLKKAYEQWGTVDARTVYYNDAREQDGAQLTEFGQLSGLRVPAFPTGEIPCVIERRPERILEAGRWKGWRTMDLPRFVDRAMIHRIEDRLYISDDGVGWDSRTYALPPEARIAGPEAPGRLRPWTGLGRVQESSRDGPWVKVKLPGFEKGDDVIDVRLGTPYSGKDGKRGLHWAPEKDTEVLVAWTGRFDQSIVLADNVRSEAAEFASPSTYLEAEHKTQFADIHVIKIGETTVDSRLALRVKQQTDVKSARQMQVNADGAELKMRGGIVYTGRGG